MSLKKRKKKQIESIYAEKSEEKNTKVGKK
jgi:hypothetical protein